MLTRLCGECDNRGKSKEYVTMDCYRYYVRKVVR